MSTKKETRSLHWKLLQINIIPIFLLVLVITGFSAKSFADALNHEVKSGLADLSTTIITLYEQLYPGDYTVHEQDGALYLFKGEHQINGNFAIIDSIKEKTGVDITFFYQDTRVITTIKDKDNNRIVGSKVNAVVQRDVLEQKEARFYSSVSINGEYYFAHYSPILYENGECMGMLFVAKPTDTVKKSVWDVITPIIFISIAAMLLAGIFTFRFSDRLIYAIVRIENFLSRVAKGNLEANLEPDVLKREDELGEVGRYAVNMQKSLRELVEKDILTGIYNRRYGDKRLQQVYQQYAVSGLHFCVAIGDIDHFKKVNDTYGHDCGDLVLIEIGKILKQEIRGKGFVARWGGEEFLLVFEERSLEESVSCVEGIIQKINSKEMIYQSETKELIIQVTMTFGIAQVNGNTVDELLKEADNKLYEGKNNGRNQIVQ